MEVCVDLVLCTVHLLPDGDVAPSLRGLHAPRAAIDLLQLSHMCWDVELQRNKSAEPLCCLLKLPPLVGNDGMCSGAIARVRPTGQVEVMCSTNVNVALQVALYARHYLRRLLHKMDQPNVEMRRVLRAVHHADQLHMEEVASNDDEEEQDPTMVDDEMMAPRVVLCNAVLHPQVEELRQLREEHFGMKEEVPTPIESNYSRTGHRPGLVVQDLDDYSSNSGDEDAAAPSRRAAGRGRNTSLLEGRPLLRGISGDQLLTWLTTFLQRRSTHTSSVGDEAPQPLRGLADEVARRLRHSGGSRDDPQEVDAELVNRVEAYLAAKQNILDAHLAHVEIHRLARPASLHVVLHWQPLGGASSCAVPPSQSAPTRTRAATAGAPPLPLFMPEPEMDMMASVECFFASVADAGEDFPPLVAMAPDAMNNVPPPTPPSTSSSWPPLAPTPSETVSCMIYATGRVQVSVPSMEVLRTVATAVLIPLLLCMADL